ncbi:EGF-like domain containing protein [Cryptosporidium felis]|nr:EGF-like domain containing protein [Cryptosporidium felis]
MKITVKLTIFLILDINFLLRLVFCSDLSNLPSNNQNIKGSKITWLSPRKFYLCDNYHFSVKTPNSFIYPKLEVSILESTLTQGFTIFLRCGKFATPYNYDNRIDIPNGLKKGSVVEGNLPLCNFPLLENDSYNIDIYVGDVDIEFTRRHYCPCLSQYVILSIGCHVEYNFNEIVTLSPYSEYDIKGPINKRNKNEQIYDSINESNFPLSSLKIFSTPVCILENEFVTICNAILQFSMDIDNIYQEKNEFSHNFCIYISPYFWREGILKLINKDTSNKRQLLDNNNLKIDGIEKIQGSSLASIPVINNHIASSFSPNICLDLEDIQNINKTITNEKLPSQLRNYIDSLKIQLTSDNNPEQITDYETNPKKINFKISFILNNIQPSKYFIYPFIFQYNIKPNVNLITNSEIKNSDIKFHYNLNYSQFSDNLNIVKWIPIKVDSKYRIDNFPNKIESSELFLNIRLNEPFYIVIPKIITNILSFDNNEIIMSVSSELHYLFKRYNCSLIIDYTGLLGRYPINNDGEYNVIKEYELRGTTIFNIASDSMVSDNSLIQIANISIPTSVINNNMPFAFRMNIKSDTNPTNLPMKYININVKQRLIPTSCKDSTCSGHGDCSITDYSNNINIYCSCYPGWGGFYCSSPYLSSQSILAYSISLVGTNFVAIPTIYVCINKRKWLVAFIAFIAGLLSSVFHAAEVGLLIDHEDLLLKGDLISAQLIISFVFILLCRFDYKIEISLLISQITILVLLTLLTTRLVTTVIPLVFCFTILFSRIIYWYLSANTYREKVPLESPKTTNIEITCTIPIEPTNTPRNLISKDHKSDFIKVQESASSSSSSNISHSFDVSKVDEIGPNKLDTPRNISIHGTNTPTHCDDHINYVNNSINISNRTKYKIINSYKKLLFIFKREYYSPRHILIGFLMGTVGCITWFLETVDTYWFFHSIWHVMAFLASTFIVHGCITPKAHISLNKSNDLGFSIKNNLCPVKIAPGQINGDLN